MELLEYEKYEKDYYDIWSILGVKETDSFDSIKEKVETFVLDKGEVIDKIDRLVWKVMRDIYYYDLYKKEKSIKVLYNSGFFLDSYVNETSNDIEILTTPLGKIKRNLLNYKGNEQLIILVSTGGFSPVHIGHIAALERSKEELEKLGYKVLGGFLSPSHDNYVNQKYNGTAKMNIEKRINLLEKVTSKSDWLMVDRWEGCYREHSINFTEVIDRTEKYVNMHLSSFLNGRTVKVAYVYGSDNIEFSRVFKYNGIGICISRGNYDLNKWDFMKDYISNEGNVFFINGLKEDISSSEIRNGKIEYLHEESLNFLYGKNTDSGVYEIREDMYLSMKNILNDRNKLYLTKKQLVKAIEENISDNLVVEILDVEKQIKLFDEFRYKNKINTISLDVFAKGDFNIGVSRLFDCSEGQIKAVSLDSRFGHERLEEQIREVPEGSYWIVDDDKASGYTVNKLTELMKKEVTIEGFIGLNDLVRKNKEKMYDVVDMRDFILGSDSGGLMVELPNGKKSRITYSLPYVCVNSRASVILGRELKFSLEIWKINMELYKDTDLKLGQLSNEIWNWVEYVGFNLDDKVTDFIKYHINFLEKYV